MFCILITKRHLTSHREDSSLTSSTFSSPLVSLFFKLLLIRWLLMQTQYWSFFSRFYKTTLLLFPVDLQPISTSNSHQCVLLFQRLLFHLLGDLRLLLWPLPLQFLVLFHRRNGRHRPKQNLCCHLDSSWGRGHASRAVRGCGGVYRWGGATVAGRVGALGAAIVVQIGDGCGGFGHFNVDAGGSCAGSRKRKRSDVIITLLRSVK